MNIHKEVLYDVEWQSLRVSLLGNFTNIEGVYSNVVKLQGYLKTTTNDKVKLWRVLNLLNAVRMGYHGQHLTNTAMDKAIIEFRDLVQKVYHECSNFPTMWDWNKVEADLEDLYAMDTSTFIKIQSNLKLRQKGALKRKTMHHRIELQTFLDLMRKLHE